MEILKSLNMEEEREIKEMQAKQRRLHLFPTPVTYIGAEVFNKHGEKTAEYFDRSRSWVQNYYYNLLSAHSNQSYLSWHNAGMGLRTISGSIYNKDYSGYIYSIGAYGESDKGIIVGSSSLTESFTDYKLDTQINHSAGSFDYMENICNISKNDNIIKVVYDRLFINNPGTDKEIKETGLVFYLNGAGNPSVMVARDVLSPGIILPNESQLKVTYTINISLPL